MHEFGFPFKTIAKQAAKHIEWRPIAWIHLTPVGIGKYGSISEMIRKKRGINPSEFASLMYAW